MRDARCRGMQQGTVQRETEKSSNTQQYDDSKSIRQSKALAQVRRSDRKGWGVTEVSWLQMTAFGLRSID